MMLVKDFMVKKVVSVRPETPLGEASRILFVSRLSGMPVVDNELKVVGIITEYDLLTKNTQLHLPTFLKLLEQFDLYKKDKTLIKDELKKILSLKVADIMNKEPLTLKTNATLDEASQIFAEHHRVNPIIIVDEDRKLAGVLSRYDLLRLYGGGKSFPLASADPGRDLDKNVDSFLKSFEKEFIFVSKFRTHYWFFISLFFAVVGFIVAFALIVRLIPR